MVARIRGAWNVEHKDDDTHGNVHSDSIATGRLTFSDIAEDTIATSPQHNYGPAGLSTAAILRLNSSLSEVSITGLAVPQDESDTVLDGRVLVVENASATTVFALEQENTNSVPRNRIDIPWEPTTTNTVARLFLFPSSLTVLVYNAKKARWVVVSRSNDEVVAYASIGGSANDFAPTGFREARVLRLDPTAANLTLSGFSSTSIPAPSRRTITNIGNYKIAILHMNTSSAAANRVACPGGVRYVLNPRESVDLYRTPSGGWRILEKADQWIDVTFAAGNFTASAGNWTLTSGDQATLCWQIDGNRMTVAFKLLTTTVSATPQKLMITIPNSRTAARDISAPLSWAKDAGTAQDTGWAEVVAGSTTIDIYKNAAKGNWATATDTTELSGQITFMVFDATASVSEDHTDVAHGDTVHADVAHSDVAHSDVAHGDSHSDSAHTDSAHSDVAHSDTTSHSDVAHDDVAHVDNAHGDVAHADSSHSDVAHVDTHDDTHGDHVDLGHTDGSPVEHTDTHTDTHGDAAHTDVAHGDSHTDSAHSDVAHSDVSHSDSSSHSDVAHSDVAHVDGGHADTHSDTAPHVDTAHADVSHADTAHADNVHEDVGLHTDSTHSDI